MDNTWRAIIALLLALNLFGSGSNNVYTLSYDNIHVADNPITIGDINEPREMCSEVLPEAGIPGGIVQEPLDGGQSTGNYLHWLPSYELHRELDWPTAPRRESTIIH